MKLKWDKSGMKTPLARARGLGAAGHGSDHWMAQRITAFANVPLVIWFVYSLVSLKGADYVSFTTWLAEPVNAILAILFIISNFYHAALGLQVVIEDYIHCEVMKTVKLVVMKLVLFGLGTAAMTFL